MTTPNPTPDTQVFTSSLYTFHRESGWYPIELKDDFQAREHAKMNPGTLKVVNELTGKVVFEHAP